MKGFLVAMAVAITAGLATVAVAVGMVPAGRATATQATPTPSAVIDPAFAARLANADPAQPIEAIVVLRQQATLPSNAGVTRTARIARVVRELRRTAASAQQPVMTLLAQRQSQKLVTRIAPLWIFNGVIVSARPKVIEELAKRTDVLEIRPSTTVTAPPPPASAALDAPVEQNLVVVNAKQVWDLGYRGQGVVVANMDTGVDATHPDLAGSWRGGTNSWYDPNGEHPQTPTDVSGHGTWTMGTMVGGSAGGTALGMAPAAKWIAAKIFNDRGQATTARIHQAFQWLLDPDGNPSTPDAPNVVNDSWVMSTVGCNLEFGLDLQRLRAAGILPVFAAGNGGPSPSTSYSPANNPEAFSVGATTNLDVLDDFSSRGPGCNGSVYPNLTAPGDNITTTDLYGGYVIATGTSMAAPHVSGALGLLLSAYPNLSADRQASALQTTALDLGNAGPDNDFGYGRLDSLAAFYWIGSTPDYTLTAGPSPATTVPGGSVSYTVTAGAVNGFSGNVDLSLSGLAASQATWSFAPATVAAGAGSSTLTVSTAASLAPGTYSLTITGTSGGAAHTVTVNLIVAPPPDFTVAASPTSATTAPGGSVSYTVSVGAVNGFSGNVDLSLSGLSPSQASWSFSPVTVAAGAGGSTLKVTTASSLAPGVYSLTITGTGAGATHAASVSLVVSRDFAVALSPASLSVSRGQSAVYTVTTTSIGGFTGNVSLSLSGMPAGATASYSRNPMPTPGSVTLTVRTTGSTQRGKFTLKLTAKSGSLVHQAASTLTVT
jgi:subtilisin family serine protease